nr:MAG TPA: hypothetical protein [Bacteriophage sp.]
MQTKKQRELIEYFLVLERQSCSTFLSSLVDRTYH